MCVVYPVFFISGPNKHTLIQLKDAVHDGLRAVKNALEDGSVVPGAGAFELAAYSVLTSSEFMNTVKGRSKYGVKVQTTFRWPFVVFFFFFKSVLYLLWVGLCRGTTDNCEGARSELWIWPSRHISEASGELIAWSMWCDVHLGMVSFLMNQS